jgi:hypothetical protein
MVEARPGACPRKEHLKNKVIELFVFVTDAVA